VVTEELGGQGYARNPDGAVVLDEAIGRPIRNVGTEVRVEAPGRRPAGDLLVEDLGPGGPIGFGRRLVGFLVVAEERAIGFGDRPIPAKVPFADGGGAVTVLLGQTCYRQPVRSNQRFAEDADDARLQARAPVVAAGERPVSRA